MNFKQGTILDPKTANIYWCKVPPYPECVVCRRVILRINEAARVEVEDPPTNKIYVSDLSTVHYIGHLICRICNEIAQTRSIEKLPVPCKLEDLKNKCKMKVRKVKSK